MIGKATAVAVLMHVDAHIIQSCQTASRWVVKTSGAWRTAPSSAPCVMQMQRTRLLVMPCSRRIMIPTNSFVYCAQACSPQYFADCAALFGGVFPHDDSVNDRTPGAKLSTAWRSTQVHLSIILPGNFAMTCAALIAGRSENAWQLAQERHQLASAERKYLPALRYASLRTLTCAWGTTYVPDFMQRSHSG